MAQNKTLNIEPQYLTGAAANLLNCGIFAPAPTQLAATTSTTGGTLAAATYFYKVTALVPTAAYGSTPAGTGETTASNEQSITTTGATSSNTITWGAVAGATGYRIYRGTASNGENLYYQVGAVTTFLDTNAASTAASPPTVNTAAPGVVPGGVGLNITQPYVIVTKIRVVNNDTTTRAVSIFKGASGASVAGTNVFWPAGFSIGAGLTAEVFCKLRLDALDYLTGFADVASKCVVELEGEIGLS